MSGIAENLEDVRARIAAAARRAGRDQSSVRLVAVTKAQPVEKIEQAVEAGHALFGENYVQEALPKIEALKSAGITWHFIGSLQKNKAKFMPNRFEVVQTVDSIELAEALNRRAAMEGAIQKALVEVNIAGEQSKSGADPSVLPELLEAMSKMGNLKVQGLMTMPPFVPAEEARPYFQALARLRGELAAGLPARVSLDELSMGMSADFEVAVEEGATIVRVGTAIFGAR